MLVYQRVSWTMNTCMNPSNQGIMNDLKPKKTFFPRFQYLHKSHLLSELQLATIFPKELSTSDFHDSCPPPNLSKSESELHFFCGKSTYEPMKSIFGIHTPLVSGFQSYSATFEIFWHGYFGCVSCGRDLFVLLTPRQRTFSFTGRGICSTMTSVPGAFCHVERWVCWM